MTTTHPSPMDKHLQFAEDIDPVGGSNGELQDLTNTLVNREKAYEMEVGTKRKRAKS